MSNCFTKYSFHYNPKTGICYRNLKSFGFPNHVIGDDGIMWSRVNNKWGISSRWKKMKIRDPLTGGYIPSNIRGENWTCIHQLVLIAFSGPCPDKMECRHLDGDKTNNKLENLAWGTRSQQYEDKRKHGGHNDGENGFGAKFKNSQIPEIHRLYESGMSTVKLGRRYGVRGGVIADIILGITYKNAQPDRMAKMRPRIKLDMQKAEEIRLKFKRGQNLQSLADEFGVTKTMISYIVTNKNWIE